MRKSLLLYALAAAAFLPALWAPFYLDDFSLWNSPVLHSAFSWGEQSRPLTWLSFVLNYRIAGETPAAWHLVNLLLHAGAVAALYSALKLRLPEAVAWTASAAFALHPIQTEPVAYVFARATLLMALFCLLSLRAWMGGKPWAAVAWFAPALLAKEECVAFPLALAALERRFSRPVAAMLAMSAAAGGRVLWIATQTPGSGAGSQSGVAPWDYLQTQGVAVLRYLRLLAAPYGFSLESPVELTTGGKAALAWLAVAAVGAAAARWGRPQWIAAAFLMLLPSSSIFPAEDLAADRRMYLPLAFLAAGLCIPRRLSFALLALWAGLSFRQSLTWTNPREIWSEAVRLSPERIRPRIQLARQLPPAEAVATLEEARAIAPEDPRIASELGRVWLEKGEAARALAEFGRALALHPGDAKALNNRGAALWRLGQREAARADFQRALEIDPGLTDARRNLELLDRP